MTIWSCSHSCNTASQSPTPIVAQRALALSDKALRHLLLQYTCAAADGKTGSDANHTDKFFTREGDQQTQAFTEALLLANMYATTPFLQCIIVTFGQVL